MAYATLLAFVASKNGLCVVLMLSAVHITGWAGKLPVTGTTCLSSRA